MQMVALYDTLTFHEDGARLELEVKSGAVSSDQSNLVLRAARMLQKEMALTHHVHKGALITLYKKIPVAAGLGGRE
jgi:4-diphosphocytidyl-2C-methyl-D-erythritol kinase